jgi:hypothetical protein
MKYLAIGLVAAALAVTLSSCGGSDKQESSGSGCLADSIYAAALIGHLRANFDDIHDVSMRFHHLDHDLNGVIRIDMHWENGRMTGSSVAVNETGNEDFANALIENMQKWYIEELAGPFDFSLPLKITIVGSDDSTFHEKGILTGEVMDEDGSPVKGAQVFLRSSEDPAIELSPCTSNREGIFVKTLIPVGDWDVLCAADGYEEAIVEDLSFEAGDHLRQKFTLEPSR